MAIVAKGWTVTANMYVQHAFTTTAMVTKEIEGAMLQGNSAIETEQLS